MDFLCCIKDVIAHESGLLPEEILYLALLLPAVVFFWHGPIVTMIMESFLDEFIYILDF